ncbi:cobalamin adenosyltransferase [Sporomusa malonica]|uniref:Ethanolamine utilization cobalamin adenosyltransferase n=1 Tax=Sporomusa malonica TaxID=112901 RepID=A0A1W2BBY2_9FIRM|nr:cobalamin adenosyltransferase [Sporomusa malonica]SMC70416.1 Ethanolamine utilization cobalamin adenosyltransferase [Sporomusa malonica]
MKFITEMELRDLYKTEPFATYVLEPDTKITPGARQFLVDRRVTLVQAQCSDDKKSNPSELKLTQQGEKWCTQRLRGRMDWIESLFLLTAAEVIRSGDAVLSEEVMALGKAFRNVRNAEREQLAPDTIQFWGWSEEEIKQRSEHLEKYVDISEFHVRLENGKEIALLNHLRASLREVEPAMLETYWNEDKQACSRQDLIDTVNLIINILCMMMWKCLGGQKWKR